MSFSNTGNVGINAGDASIKANLDIVGRPVDLSKPDHTPQGVSFPNFTTQERSTFENVKPGTMIYNTTKKCLEIFLGVVNKVYQWDCVTSSTSVQAQNVAVVPIGFEGVYVAGVPFTDANKVKFELQNNGFSPISNVDFSSAVSLQNAGASIGVKGGENTSVSLQAGAKTTLSYTLTGTPQEGVLIANFNHLGLTADVQTQIGLGNASIANKEHYVVSMYYQPTNTRIQGKINNGAEKLTIKIPYTNGKGSYNAVNINNIKTAAGQNGDINNLSLSIPAGNFGVQGELIATISVDGDGEYLVKQMAPGEQYTIATFPIDMNGTHYNVVLKGIGGIPDKNFNVKTNGKYEHKFIYVPVKGRDGKLWLNNNLGANYANVDHPAFNPVQQAKSIDDENAYGSHFQWGRPADGHELVNYTSKHDGTWVHPGMFNKVKLGTYNNECPEGYHVPTKAEWEEYTKLLDIKDDAKEVLLNDVLKLPGTGMLLDGSYGPEWTWSQRPGWYQTYTTSTVNYDDMVYVYNTRIGGGRWVSLTMAPMSQMIMFFGRAVRCRQD
ncbi:FISUMP domain-containing protein [Ornithobacterium rhinotracheale]|uniref:FISUMP domain-containing protein n=1 Tax=Ornithobacterium rhinotracheale TaxID=28251 RepID=UPI001FF5A36E|nr:FISUMP domain-containing protein [Ornithobacterium rhinotracheale]MCK0206388.1 hypothetical protein [Ornithobacterium rhinotracheale]